MELLKRHTDYSIRALVTLAEVPAGTMLSARRIARSAEVHEPILRKLLQRLVRAGIVLSVRGVQGGFRLARPAARINIFEVAEIAQGPIAVNRCLLGRGRCPRQDRCPISEKLIGLQEHLASLFRSVTLTDLMAPAHPPAKALGG
ncbi:MAG: Rrf2 family transcriptional regulator [Planctomycetota bacterium]